MGVRSQPEIIGDKLIVRETYRLLEQKTENLTLVDYPIGNKYLRGLLIGNGSSAEVFLGTNVQTNEHVAMKLEPMKSKNPQLLFESKLYKILKGGTGIVDTRWYGPQAKYRVLVMDLLGPTLEELKNFCSQKFSCSEEEIARFSLKTVLMLADQLISVLHYIHSKGFVHRDIKPDNLLMGLGRRANQVHIIDFGLAKKWCHPNTKEHIPYKDNKNLVGSARFASINNHNGIEQSRRDDLESLGYVLVYLLKGRLPWQDVKADSREENHEKIGKMKSNMCADVLCEGLSPQFAKFVRLARTLPFEAEPDYEGYRKMFQECFVSEGFGRDYIFDWTVIHYAMAGVPRTFNGVIPDCSERCWENPPPPVVTFEPPKLGHPELPRSRTQKKEQIPQGKLIDLSPNPGVNYHKLFWE